MILCLYLFFYNKLERNKYHSSLTQKKYMSIFSIHYEKRREANANAQRSLTIGQYFPMKPVVKKDGSFVIIGERKK